MKEMSIVIPTLWRSHLLGRLVWNIVKTTPPGAFYIYFVVDQADDMTGMFLKRLDGPFTAVETKRRGYPPAVNTGVSAGEEPFVTITNDDVSFHDGWYQAVMDAFADGVDVVAPDDLSPSTANHDNCTMPIVRRSYIDDPGGAWQEPPGVAMHEGYHHNFAETELWQLAEHRGVAKFVDTCVIEHHHPDWGKREMDDTYAEGAKQRWNEDAALFEQRRQEWRQS